MTHPLEAYSVVGDMRTIAAINADGGIDWLCWPRFDSPSIFGRLLDDDGGSWTLGPVGIDHPGTQVYTSSTNVLVTQFHVAGALVEVSDFMSLGDDGAHLVRLAHCRRGSVTMRSVLTPRPDYGRSTAEFTVVNQDQDDGDDRGDGGDGVGHVVVSATNDGAHPLGDGVEPLRVHVSGSVGWTVEDDHLVCEFDMTQGDVVHLVLGDGPLDADECASIHERTVASWHRWSARTSYRGRWREAVERSALLLKLLTHDESGGIIAAGTTSLPEAVGGGRNWDYRYVWIRDAAFTVYAFIKLGHLEEAQAFTSWLIDRLSACDDADTPPLAPLYDLDGRSDIDEIELDHWSGYLDSSPVRIGNAASGQIQLDIYGELIDALYLADKYTGGVSIDTWRHICSIVDWLSRHWNDPDDGMWEARSGPQHHTTSLLMCWVAVERSIRMARRRGRPAPLDEWYALRDRIHDELVDRGFDDELGAFTQVLDGDTLDASILLAPLVKFISPSDPMWLSTLDAIGDTLAHGALVDRYDPEATDDGLDGDEGSFTICSFWYVEALARSGRVEEAEVLFDRLLSYAGPTGIFSEEIGPEGQQLGNLPQAFTHLSLVSAALALDEALGT